MTEYSAEKILHNLELEIKQSDFIQPTQLSGDKWILASGYQKSLRRGETETALRCAAALWHQDRLSFWRRHHTAVLEDIGIAAPDVLVKVLTATTSTYWRQRVGDLRVALHLTRLICEATKTRIADELLLICERSSNHTSLREHFSHASNEQLTDYIIGSNYSLIEKGLAIWFFGGTNNFKTELMPQRKGSIHKLSEVLRTLSTPTDLVEACIGVIGRTQWPLAALTPIIWQEVQKHDISIKHNIIPVPKDFEGIPYYSADTFTRVGQTCLRQLQKSVSELQCFTVKQLGVALFAIEGGLLDKYLSSPFLDDFASAGEIAYAEGEGLPIERYLIMRDCLKDNMELLQIIRSKQLFRYLNGSELGNITVIQGNPTFTPSDAKGEV